MDQLIKQAKQISLLEYYQDALIPKGHYQVGICPFHEDSSPSFAYYPDTNSWYCFAGCGGGSVIDFYMKLFKTDFKTAVRSMTYGHI